MDKNEQFAQEHKYKSISVKVYNVSEKMQQLLKQRGYQAVKIEQLKADSKYNAIRFELKFRV